MPFPEQTLELLGLPQLRAELARRCRTELGQERAAARPLLETAEQVAEALALVEEARGLAREPLSLPLAGLTDLRPALERAQKSAVLEPRELIACAQGLFAFERVREVLAERAAQRPRLAQLAARLPRLEPLARRLDDAFEPDGSLSDRASPELRRARDQARGLHRRIKARLEELLRDERFVTNLRESYYSIRHDRYVVPVLAQQQAEIPGIVHNASQSGQTLFVEPQMLVGLGNELAIAQSLVAEEERRVLSELTGQVGAAAGRIREGLEAAGRLDEAEAAAHLAAELEAHGPAPEPSRGSLQLRQLRHPFLALRQGDVVANDVALSDPARALIISGPNAGGKTVTLTAVGLCALMLRAGLPIPAADGSRLPLYTDVQASLGDAQDLAQGLSTFSAHLLALRRIQEAAGPGSLILIDEIAADTDPREGAALAIAVLEDLVDRGATVLVTTHLEEVKALAFSDPRFLGGRVGFDSRRMAPTFRLQLGASGGSSALEVAARMGLPAPILERARALLASSGGPLAQALAAAEEQQRRAGQELERAQAAAQQAEWRLAEIEATREQALRKLEEERLEQLSRMEEALDRAVAEGREVLSRMREEPSPAEAQKLQRQLLARQREAEARTQEAKLEQLRSRGPSAPAPLEVGGRARHLSLGQDVEILALEGEEAVVAAGAMKVRAKRSELGPAQGKPRKERPRPFASDAMARAQAAAGAAPQSGLQRLDARGMRVEDALRELERLLDLAVRAGEPTVTVLHGHGTGALRDGLRAHLAESPYVRMFRPGEAHEGGDAVTVIALKI